jgi:HD-like signal output (HDOD) protein
MEHPQRKTVRIRESRCILHPVNNTARRHLPRFFLPAMELNALLAQPNALPSAPQAVAKLIKTFDDEDASTDDIVECIEADPVIVAKLLRLANSPFFFRGRTIESVSDAVRLLGQSQVRSLVIGLIARDSFPALPPAVLQQFWRFSLTTADLARHVSRNISSDSEAAYTGALLHMIGALVMRVGMTEKMMALDRITPPLSIGRGKAEVEMLGYSYAEVGAALARLWQLPASIVRVIETQRTPDLTDARNFDAAVVQLASWRARAIEMSLPEDVQIRLYPVSIGKALGVDPASIVRWSPDYDESANDA